MLGLNGTSGVFNHTILAITLVIYFIMVPIVSFLSVIFLDFEIYKNNYQFQKKHSIYIIVIIISIILSILSIRGNYLFDLSTVSNTYSQGIFNTWYIIIIFTVAFLGFFSNPKVGRVKKVDLIPLILFILSPILAIIFLLIFKKTNLVWNALTISLLISYIFAQLKIANTDYLTGLFNRREFEYQLAKIKTTGNKNEHIFGMIIDLDDFKNINDLYGHVEGDLALVKIGDILKNSVRKYDFVSRIGGDEFAILLSAKDSEVVELIVDRMNENIIAFNQESQYKFNLKISYGYDYYDEKKFPTVIDFFNHIDMKMYNQKNNENKTKRLN